MSQNELVLTHRSPVSRGVKKGSRRPFSTLFSSVSSVSNNNNTNNTSSNSVGVYKHSPRTQHQSLFFLGPSAAPRGAFAFFRAPFFLALVFCLFYCWVNDVLEVTTSKFVLFSNDEHGGFLSPNS